MWQPKIFTNMEVIKNVDDILRDQSEWTYNMRREMQEIIPNLFLGPYSVACKIKKDYLKENGITHIICVRQDIEAHFIKPNFYEDFVYLTLSIADNCNENIIHHFNIAYDFIEECLSKGGRVLIHGNQGISRSPAIVAAYLMKKYDYNAETARVLVLSRRYCISLNPWFLYQLKAYESIYKAEKFTRSIVESSHDRGTKRTIDSME